MTKREAIISGWISVYGIMPTPLISDTLELIRRETWVSVKDRLPDESGIVLVYCNGYITNVHYSKKHQKFNMFDCIKDEDAKEYSAFDDVTHWMPLPEPPKGGESE
jgi:hypothetical protein